jgi:hypothetical protein
MKKNERVLAYNMASVIELESLQQVSGGASSGMTHHQTVKMSSAALPDVDAFFDVVADW